MKFEMVKDLDDEKFRRLTGVKRTTFMRMISILDQANRNKKVNGGRKNKLSTENMLLMSLEYIREYRLSKLVDMHLDGDIDSETYHTKLDEYKKRQREINRRWKLTSMQMKLVLSQQKQSWI